MRIVNQGGRWLERCKSFRYGTWSGKFGGFMVLRIIVNICKTSLGMRLILFYINNI